MSAAYNPLGDGIPEDRSVREIVAVCAKHGVPHAEPESLTEFVRSLQHDKHFAMDFWSVVARLTRDSSNPDWLLAVIVEGVTGQTVAEVSAANPTAKPLFDKLAQMLAGQDLSGLERFSPQSARESSPPMPPDQRSRLTLDPEPPVASAEPLGAAAASPSHPLPEPASEPRLVIPLASYADRDREGVAPARLLAGVLVLALLVGGGLWVAHRRHSSDRQSLSAAIRAGDTSADSMLHRAYMHLFRPHIRSANPSSATPPTIPMLTAVPQQPTAAPPKPPSISPPLTQSGPAPNQPAASAPSQSEATQGKPAQHQPRQAEAASNESAPSEPAPGKTAQPVANRPALAKRSKAVDPVVLEAARESQQQ